VGKEVGNSRKFDEKAEFDEETVGNCTKKFDD
jgi:hypothetical protein